MKKIFDDPVHRQEFMMDCGKKEKKIPRGFEDFINSDLCADILTSLFEYCIFLIRIEDKKLKLEAEAKQLNIPVPSLLASETTRLQQKARQVSDNYARFLYMNRSIGQQTRLN